MVEIVDIASSGLGIAKKDGKVIFIENTLVGEQVEYNIVQEKKHFSLAKPTAIIVKSPHRVKPLCKYYSTCGACNLMHINYQEQLNLKKHFVQSTLKKIAKIDFSVSNVVASQNQTAYRNKASFAIANGKIGYYEQGTHRIIQIEHCPLLDPKLNAMLKTLKDQATTLKGINHAVVRSLNSNTSLTLVSARAESVDKKALMEGFSQSNIQNISLNYSSNPKKILGPTTEIISGRASLDYTCLGNNFEVSPTAFLQVNTSQTEMLYTVALSQVNLAGKTVVDAFCGIGTITLAIAKKAASVLGIEENPDSIKNAKKAALQNGYSNAFFLCGRCEKLIQKALPKDASVLVVDPPRSGLDKSFIATVLRSKLKEVLYISCDVATLARDIELFKQGNFNLRSLTPVDMFPHTNHIECVALLTR